MNVDTFSCCPKNGSIRLANGARIESGIVHLTHLVNSARIICHYPPSFSDLPRQKKEPHIRVLAGILVPFGVNYMAESRSIVGALVAHRRGVNLPYFGKQVNI
jgi:hypothetical protein